ncbi:uncharacterized protein LOC108198086 [Daucus carota subsp. sativus]
MRWIDNPQKRGINPRIVEGLIKMFDKVNVLVQRFRQARDRFKEDNIVQLKIHMKASRSVSGRPNNISPSDEVAAVLVGDTKYTKGVRDIVVESNIKGLTRIPEIHPLRASLQFPILFPNGEDGYHEHLHYYKKGKRKTGEKKRDKITAKEYYFYKLQVRKNQDYTLRLGGRLFQQYIVDSFSSIEQARLYWVRKHQKELRRDLYNNIRDQVRIGDGDSSNIGRSYILPSSFTGSKRYMQQNFQDALAVCRVIGHTDLFLTMTCNTEWDEMQKMMDLLPGCLMYVVEYQKRGLPHIHMLIWLDGSAKPNTCEKADDLVNAEIPDPETEPELYEVVKKFMIHGPCGKQNPKCPCMKDFKCTRHFPKKYSPSTSFDSSGFPIYKHRKTSKNVKVRKGVLDNQWVVPYNKYSLLRYQCHINLEICAHASSLKYLFKYCLKGHDQATVLINTQKVTNVPGTKEQVIDEIKTFLDGRYICGVEAGHRIYGFDVHHRTIAVQRLPFHLPHQKTCTFRSKDDRASVERLWSMKKSKLEAYFELNKVDISAQKYSYSQIPQFYVWDGQSTMWCSRKKGYQIGRLTYTHHGSGELWYLRMLLCRICGPTSFKDLLIVGGVVYPTFQAACDARGWLASDKEWDEALTECSSVGFANQVRELFVYIILNCKVYDIGTLWIKHNLKMSEDILYKRRKVTCKNDLVLSEKEIEFYALAEIDNLLRSVGNSLERFNNLPQPDGSYLNSGNDNLIVEETSYNIEEELHRHNEMFKQLNHEQLQVYQSIIHSVNNKTGGIFFVYGSGGCGKTYLWGTIISKLLSQRKIVFPVASSGIAATLMPGGRTAHSRFKIPIIIDEDSSCNISHKSDISQLLKKTELIIWDEAPMQHRFAFEALDRTLCDIIKSISQDRHEKTFGGITVLLGGDFRQILPVINRAPRSEVVSASINRSRLWDESQLYLLTENMRVNKGNSEKQKEIARRFNQWVLDIGNGKIPSCTEDGDVFDDVDIEIPEEFCIKSDNFSVEEIINSTYPELLSNYKDEVYMRGRAILTPTNEIVHEVNAVILEKLPGLPPHNVLLKENVVVMLMRNLNQISGTLHFIPRIEMSPTDSHLPFKLNRLQLPLQICYAMTINKSQGQSLDRVSLYLPRSVFSHGQLYVAISRVTSPSGLKIYIKGPNGRCTNVTKNAVYEEVFYNLPNGLN